MGGQEAGGRNAGRWWGSEVGGGVGGRLGGWDEAGGRAGWWVGRGGQGGQGEQGRQAGRQRAGAGAMTVAIADLTMRLWR